MQLSQPPIGRYRYFYSWREPDGIYPPAPYYQITHIGCGAILYDAFREKSYSNRSPPHNETLACSFNNDIILAAHIQKETKNSPREHLGFIIIENDKYSELGPERRERDGCIARHGKYPCQYTVVRN